MSNSRFASKEIALPLLHVTHENSLPSIFRHGLQSCYGRRRRVVWLCDADRLIWALQHVPESHGWQESDVQVLAAYVPRTWLATFRNGVYICSRDIPSWLITMS